MARGRKRRWRERPVLRNARLGHGGWQATDRRSRPRIPVVSDRGVDDRCEGDVKRAIWFLVSSGIHQRNRRGCRGEALVRRTRRWAGARATPRICSSKALAIGLNRILPSVPSCRGRLAKTVAKASCTIMTVPTRAWKRTAPVTLPSSAPQNILSRAMTRSTLVRPYRAARIVSWRAGWKESGANPVLA